MIEKLSVKTKVIKISWILFLIFLPVTNFPFFPSGLGGVALVRPLSFFPFMLLFIFVTVPLFFKKTAPRTFITLLPFIIIATASSLISLLQGTDSLLGVSVAQRIMRALITLGIGITVYLTIILWVENKEQLRFLLRWIYIGYGFALIWCTLQAVYVIYFMPGYFEWINSIQKFVSSRNLIESRVSGLTYEPNWFAGQICLLLIPWLLASVLFKYSVFKWRWITLEWILFIWSIVVLTFTFSRSAIVVFLVLMVSGLLFLRPNHQNDKSKGRTRHNIFRRMLETFVVVMATLVFIFVVGLNNNFFSRIWNYWTSDKAGVFYNYFDYLGFGARFTYGETAYRIYENNPLFGVGLGNYAFYFEEMLPDRLLAETPEVLHILTQNANRYRLITPKNLYLRILAETGLLGFSAFMVFIVAIIGCALYLRFSPDDEQRFWGTSGLLVLISFFIVAMSFDSFTFPDMWVVFGITTSAAWMFNKISESMIGEELKVISRV